MTLRTSRTADQVRSPAWYRAGLCSLTLAAVLTAAGVFGMVAQAKTPGPAPSKTADPKVALGEQLFFDQRLSVDGTVSCASCHVPEKYFSDGLPVSKGVAGRLGARNAPSVLNALENHSQFWDGRALTLETQALAPFTNPNEMGLADTQALVQLVRADKRYVAAFARVFGAKEAINADQIAGAIASYERTLVAPPAPFDRHTNEAPAMSPAAVRGYQLFTGRAKCGACHLVTGPASTFTDEQFHGLSVGLSRVTDQLAPLSMKVVALRQGGKSPDDVLIQIPESAALGRFVVSLQPAEIGAFRTPSLRNVAETAPYMHDGSIETLEEAVEHEIYYRSAEQGRPMLLTPVERQELVAFLQALTSPREAVLAKGPKTTVKPKAGVAHAL